MDMATFGGRLKELRNSKNITQKELSRILNLSESAVSMYERDEREPSFETQNKLSDFFDVTRAYLLGDTDDPDGHTPRQPTKDEIRDKALFFDEENMDEEDWELVKQTYERLRKKRKKDK
jgi:transcriptional regulator with XRE-family HTH domain